MNIKVNNTTERYHSLWTLAFKKLLKDKVALSCILLIGSYVLLAILAKLGFIGNNWSEAVILTLDE